jgi:glycosyltransferase involved in cell wall biosynthesis
VRIAIYYDLPAGGAKRALHGHVRGLLARGHDLELWRPPGGDDAKPPIGALAPEHVVPFDGPPPAWWRPGRVAGIRSPTPFIKRASAHAEICAAEIEQSGFDVLLAATDRVFGSPPIARFTRLLPTVLYLQEPHRALYEASPEFPWLGSPPSASIFRGVMEPLRILRRSQRARFEVDNAAAFGTVLVNSYFSREAVMRIYGLDATVCYLGVDTDVFRPMGVNREHVIVGVGNLARHKKPHALVEAVAQLQEPRPRVEWIAASVDDTYQAEVQAAADAAGVQFVIRPAATDEVLVDALNRARAVVYTPRLEPFGLVPLEANACATPVIGIAEGGVRETVADGVNGILINSLETDLTAAIKRILDDPDWAEQLGREGRRQVEKHWTQEAANDRLEAALQAAVAAR